MNIKLKSKEQLENILATGKYVAVRDNEDREFVIFSPNKDRDGNYRTSARCNTLEEAKQYVGDYYGYDDLQEAIDEEDFSIIEVWYQRDEYDWSKETHAYILEDAEYWSKRLEYAWNEEKKKMVGNKLKIKEIGECYINFYQEDKKDFWTFPCECLIPGSAVEEKETDKTKNMIEDLKKLGYKITKC